MSSVQNDGLKDRMLGCLLGGIAGDAKGSEYEFRERDSYTVSLDRYEPNETWRLPPGSFTDDSSMMLCLAESLTVCRGMDTNDQMERYVRWHREGHMSSSTSRGCFDLGRTTATAIGAYAYAKRIAEHQTETHAEKRPERFYKTVLYGPTGDMNAGNGGIMRLGPVPVFFWRSRKTALDAARLSSAVTHGNKECLDCASLMGDVIFKGVNGFSKDVVLENSSLPVSGERIRGLCAGKFRGKPRKDISTSGYVVDTLEAALWAFERSSSYFEGLATLLPMGGDVDTVCCVYGQIAGAFYGYSSIPPWLLDGLQRKDLVARTVHALVTVALDQ
jgi:ADP-ribosyl-[dinitrogen reductase] hydrolase